MQDIVSTASDLRVLQKQAPCGDDAQESTSRELHAAGLVTEAALYCTGARRGRAEKAAPKEVVEEAAEASAAPMEGVETAAEALEKPRAKGKASAKPKAEPKAAAKRTAEPKAIKAATKVHNMACEVHVKPFKCVSKSQR